MIGKQILKSRVALGSAIPTSMSMSMSNVKMNASNPEMMEGGRDREAKAFLKARNR